MEKRERFVIEVLLGAILIVFLILVAFFVTAIASGPDSNKGAPSTVINSYNNQVITPKQTVKSYIVDRHPAVHRDRHFNTAVYYVDDDFRYANRVYDDRYLRFDDFGQRRIVNGIFGNEIDNYAVYVKNQDRKGGYFRVRFHFEDYYGERNSESVTHYIKPHEEKRFLFRDISYDDRDYRRWWYEVIPETKVPARVYYN